MWPEGWRNGGASLGTGRLNNKTRVRVFIVSFQLPLNFPTCSDYSISKSLSEHGDRPRDRKQAGTEAGTEAFVPCPNDSGETEFELLGHGSKELALSPGCGAGHLYDSFPSQPCPSLSTIRCCRAAGLESGPAAIR